MIVKRGISKTLDSRKTLGEDNQVYSTTIAYLLWALGGFSTLGFHRFYLGKIGTGILYFFTGGLGFIGSLYDFFTLPMQVRERNIENRYRRVLDLDEGYVTRPQLTREPKKESIEKVILRTAKKNGGIATPAEVALDGDITLEEAKKHLEKLVSNGFAEIRVNKKGTIVYIFQDFLTDDADKNLEDF